MGFASQENFDVSRIKVLWFGPRPNDQDLGVIEPGGLNYFGRRQLALEFIGNDKAQWEKELNYAKGIVIQYNSNKPAFFKNFLLSLAPLAIDYGILLCIIVDDASFHIVANFLADFKINDLKGAATIYSARPLYNMAEDIARHDPGRHIYDGLIISGDTKSLDENRYAAFLLKRAFSDCSRIEIEPQLGGRGGATNVLLVQATIRSSPTEGKRSLPFFAKINKRDDIKQEWDNYKRYASNYIPFNLRPNLDESRYILGYRYGIIVGNFVEESEPLLEAASRGIAEPAIYFLFENTLKGWRSHAKEHESNIYVPYYEKRGTPPPLIKLDKISEGRLSFSRQYGATRNPEELAHILRQLPACKHLRGPVHGDLHAMNIRVRNHDAVLIDFFHTAEDSPLLSDHASLELSLAFLTPIPDTDKVPKFYKDFNVWTNLVDELYDFDFLKKPPQKSPTSLKNAYPKFWLWSCIRKIRLLAFSERHSEFEYNTLIAIHLLRLAARERDPVKEADENERLAYAYVLAERLIVKLGEDLIR